MAEENTDIKVRVAPDGMSAFLEPVPAKRGGRGGVAKLLQKALLEAGVRRGTDPEALKKVFALLAAGRPVPETTVARGRPADDSMGGRIEYLVSLDREEIGTRDKVSGHIDFRDKGRLPQVKEGQELARLIPPQKGSQGYTVTGLRLDSEPPRPMVLEAGKNVVREGDTLIAARDGLLALVRPDRLAVLEVLELEAVDNESGHIEFSGLVRVRGGVAGGFRVKAEGLEADNVEAEALVEVENSVRIAGPVLGARIKAGGRVECALLRKSEVECGGDLVVAHEIVESRARVGGRVLLDSPQGGIVNSELTAGAGVETGRVVCRGKNPCRIVLGLEEKPASSGQDPAALLEREEALLKDLAREWRRTKKADLAKQIKEKAALIKELRGQVAAGPAGPKPEAGEKKSPRPYLSVRDSADPGLTIQGKQAVLTLDRPLQAFTAREVLKTDPQTGREEWVMGISEPKT